ncbi:MAG: alpha/beta hydrolase [Rhodobacteraceae bacterium]|nr:alpha/beta hydrolase [Paracoccaceae bacterium]
MASLPGFETRMIKANGVNLAVQEGGEGPPLILLHGFPQTHMCWARTAPEFARHFHVIAPDLRGYGDSDAPTDDPEHLTYSKREMARDIVGLMDHFGWDRASVLGHDRGARVSYRLALDHPERIHRLGLLEILPTADYWQNWGHSLGFSAYHWTFLAQPAPMPERMIGSDPEFYADWILTKWSKDKTLDAFAPDALADYRRQMADPAHCTAMCADYRAGYGPDRDHDEADLAAGRKITAPVHVLCGDGGFPARAGDPETAWRRWADDVTVAMCPSGHFLAEENPQAVLDTFLPFFGN